MDHVDGIVEFDFFLLSRGGGQHVRALVVEVSRRRNKMWFVGVCVCTYVANFLDFAAALSDDTSCQALMDQNTKIDFTVVLQKKREKKTKWFALVICCAMDVMD